MNRFEEAEIMRCETPDLEAHITKVNREIVEEWPEWNRKFVLDQVAAELASLTPEPIDWQPRDWARDGQFLKLIRSITGDRCAEVTPFGLYGSIHGNSTYTIDLSALTIPTRAQLAKEIGKDKDGKPILAWACEMDVKPAKGDSFFIGFSLIMYSDHLYQDGAPVSYVVRDEHVRDSHIPLVTVSQIDRHYNGVFPPKEAL